MTLPIMAQNKKALIVIDVQENLLKSKSTMHMDIDKVDPFVTSLNRSIKIFEQQGMPVIYTINEWTNPILNLITGNVCKKGAKGTEISSRVSVVSKNIFYKSSSDIFSNEKLRDFLKRESISELYITGLLAEYCVKSSVNSALDSQFKVTIIEDAVGSKNEKNKAKSMSRCSVKGANVIHSSTMVKFD